MVAFDQRWESLNVSCGIRALFGGHEGAVNVCNWKWCDANLALGRFIWKLWEEPDLRYVISIDNSSDASSSGQAEVGLWEREGELGGRFQGGVAGKNTGLEIDKLVWPQTVTLGKLFALFVSPLGPCLKMATSTLNSIGLIGCSSSVTLRKSKNQ